ncbi:MAG: hypothetical protein HYY93_05245 [Planctomycetes bacterium]|nr:hypothetical protein [Planctomycetota bacterium]
MTAHRGRGTAHARLRILVALSLAVLTPSRLSAQDLTPVECEAAAELGQKPDGFCFVVNGRSNLPDHAVLGLGLTFAGEIVPDMWRKADVVKGRFRVELGPVARTLLAGYYRVSLQYAPSFQYVNRRAALAGFVPEAKWEISCYVGSPETEELEDAQYRRFLRESVTKIRDLYKDLDEHHERYLAGETTPFVLSEFQDWTRQWRTSLDATRQQNTRHGSETVLAPLYPDSVRDLTVITDFLDLVYLEYTTEICRKRDLPIAAAGNPGDHPPFTLMAAEYVREASRRTEAILERLNTDPGTDSYALYRDLVEIDGLFRDLVEFANRLREKPDGVPWGPWHMRWAARVARVASGFSRYSASPLAQTHPALRDDLAQVASALTEFGNALGRMLPGAPETGPVPRPPEGDAVIDPKADCAQAPAAREIRKQLNALFEILSTERRTLVKRLEEDLATAGKLRDELARHRAEVAAGRETLQEWETWGADWQVRLEDFRKVVASTGADPTFRFHFPEAQRAESTLAQALAEAWREHTAAVHGNVAPTYEERVKYFGDVIARMCDRLRKMIEAVAPPK